MSDRSTRIQIENSSGLPVDFATEAKQDTQIQQLADLVGFEIPAYDYVSCSYTGDNLTGVVYKTGGSGGTTVATLTIAYSGSNITSITKT